MGQLRPKIVRIAGIATAILVAPAAISMWPRIVALGVLPAVLGIVLVALSLRAVTRQPSAAQIVLAALSISLSVISLWTLKRIFLDGAWPTYLPYYGFAVAIPFVMVQSYLADAK
jgi:hypothetical protein